MKITFESSFYTAVASWLKKGEEKAQSFTVANSCASFFPIAGDSVVELDNFTSNKR